VSYRGALVRLERRPELEHHPAEARDEPRVARPSGDLEQVRLGGLRILCCPVVERDSEPLVLDRPRDALGELTQPRGPCRRFGVELETVLPDVDEVVEPDDAPRVVTGAAAHAGNERVPAVQPTELLAGFLRHARVFGTIDDGG